MKKTTITIVIILLVLGSLGLAMKMRAPKAPQPTTSELQARDGIPVETQPVVLGDMEQLVDLTGDIQALDSMTLSAKISGRVAQVNAREGDTVSRGQAVIVLDQEDALSNLQAAQAGLESALSRLSQAKTNAKVTKIQTDAAIEQAQASLSAAKAKLAVVKVPTRNQDRMIAENKVAAAEANLENKEADYKRYKMLLDKGAIAASSFDVVKTQYTIAKTDLKTAKDQLALIKEGGRSEDVSAAQSQVAVAREQLRSAKANASQNMLRQEDVKSALAAVQQAQATLSLAKQQLANTYIKSPISGQMATRSTEPGQVVSPGQALGSVVSMGSLYFKGEVSETEIASIQKGREVKVRVDAVKGHEFKGVVDEIYPSGSTLSRNFPVRIRIVDKSGLIRPGMFARGSVITGMDRNVLLVPKDALEERRGSQMVFSTDGGKKAIRHNVQVIRMNRNQVEIEQIAGLEPGDLLVTSGKQNLQNGSKIIVENAR
ncbi:MAG: efflux RND transporter periplasmic adaptor subunit [Armatimonadota bacterium]|nr:efflux RND transporter periplasmic adaptor subunit [bacterium]